MEASQRRDAIVKLLGQGGPRTTTEVHKELGGRDPTNLDKQSTPYFRSIREMAESDLKVLVKQGLVRRLNTTPISWEIVSDSE